MRLSRATVILLESLGDEDAQCALAFETYGDWFYTVGTGVWRACPHDARWALGAS